MVAFGSVNKENEDVVARRAVWSWAAYDWANSAFATAVMAGFFPLFFKQYWNAGVDPSISTFRLAVANSGAGIVILILAPLLGAIADAGGRRKRALILFATLGICMTLGLYFQVRGQWLSAGLLYAMAVIGFAGANIFYDALLLDVAQERRLDQISALGFGLGYLGGGLIFALNVIMVQRPGWFGLESAEQAVRIAFLMVAVWWAVFSLPLIFFVKEKPAAVDSDNLLQLARAGARQLIITFQHIRELKVVGLFLGAYWLYIDGVDTVVRMAVDYGMALGFDGGQLVMALLLTQFVAFPAAIFFGYLGHRIGAKQGIMLAIGVYVGITIWGFYLETVAEFYALAVAVGLVQGGIQSLSRSLYARLIPRNRSAEFFGFYNMFGKFAAVIGPLLMGAVSLATGEPRYSILALLVLFIGGGVVLWRVDVATGRQMAVEMERV